LPTQPGTLILPTRVAETSVPPKGNVEIINLNEHCPGDRRHYQLRDPLTVANDKWFAPVVDDDHSDLTTVIGINGPGGIHQGNAVLEGQSAPRTHLGFITIGKGYGDAGEDEGTLSWLEYQIGSKLRIEVHTGSMGGEVVGKRVAPFPSDSFDVHRGCPVRFGHR
jgi:hypothetical protein